MDENRVGGRKRCRQEGREDDGTGPWVEVVDFDESPVGRNCQFETRLDDDRSKTQHQPRRENADAPPFIRWCAADLHGDDREG